MYQSTKLIQKLSTEVKGNNSCYHKFGRAITKWEAIQKRIYKADAKNAEQQFLLLHYLEK